MHYTGHMPRCRLEHICTGIMIASLKYIVTMVLGVIVGVIIALLSQKEFISNKAVSFANSELKFYERASLEAFQTLPPRSSLLTQFYLLIYVDDSYKHGLITSEQFHRITALGETRTCIAYEAIGEISKAAGFCKLAKYELSKWNATVEFSEFKKKQVELMEKR